MPQELSESRRIVLAGGGTGGHVYPLLAIVEALEAAGQRPAVQYTWIGSERAESRIVPQFSADYGIPIDFRQIDVRFSYRWPTPANWDYYRRHLFPLLLGRPFRQARELLQELRPSLVLASGGYVSAPVLWAAHRLGIPYALLQLDAVPGLVNAHFCGRSVRVYCATEQAKDLLAARCGEARLRVCGFPARRPRRGREAVLAELGVQPGCRLLVAMGGSLGAGAVARGAQALMEWLDESGPPLANRLAMLAVGGARSPAPPAEPTERPPGWVDCQIPKRRLVQSITVDYIEDSPSLMHAADFYFGRAGASSVAELLDCGIPALLVPDPQHADRQQYHNARVLTERGQAQVLDQSEVSAEAVAEWLAAAWDSPRSPAPEPRPADAIAADINGLIEGRL